MYGNQYYNQMQRYQPVQMPTYQMPNLQVSANNGLLGKTVDSIEVVKATDIPLDGSISYFPLSDGSAIISKQLQMDGTSKMVVYKPMVEKVKEQPKYVTVEQLQKEIEKIDLTEIKEEIEDLKKQIKSKK